MSITISPRDAWVIARLLSIETVNGELDIIGDGLRAIAEIMARAPRVERGAILDTFLADNGFDREAIDRAILDEDPEGPPPGPEAAEGGAPPKPRPRVKMTRAADVTCRPVDWLWRDRVPRGMLTLLAGDPKLGKSLVTLATAAAVSRGAALPGDEPPGSAGSVVILSAEDDPARTIVPRLRAAGADLTRIHILESVYLDDGDEAQPSLRKDIDVIEEAVAALADCRLVVFDPISAYLGGTDDHKNGELRGVLSPLKLMAERTDTAVVLVTHLSKAPGTNGKHRVTGSIAHVGASRSNFLFVKDRDDPTGCRVLMIANGCNLAGDVPTLGYVIEDRGDGPAVEWGVDPVAVTAEQALSAERDDPAEREDRKACDRWLRDVLAKGPVPQSEIEKAGRDAGFGTSALRRGKQRLGARSRRVGFGKGSVCSWTLGDDAPDHDPEPPIDFGEAP